MMWLVLYLIFCLIGVALEWGYGTFWGLLDKTPWVYPDSPLRYTSLEGIPLWGFGGLICVSVYRAIVERKPRRLIVSLASLALAALWITVYTTLF